MAEDIRDAILEYQVGGDNTLAVLVSPKLNPSIDDPATGDIQPEVQVDCELQKQCYGNKSDGEFVP